MALCILWCYSHKHRHFCVCHVTGQIGQILKIKKYFGWNEVGDHCNVFHLILIHPEYSLVHPKLPVVAVERGRSEYLGGWRSVARE